MLTGLLGGLVVSLSMGLRTGRDREGILAARAVAPVIADGAAGSGNEGDGRRKGGAVPSEGWRGVSPATQDRGAQEFTAEEKEKLALIRQTDICLISSNSFSEIDRRFVDAFKLSPDEVTAANTAIQNAIGQLETFEAAHLKVLHSQPGAVQLEIPAYAADGAGVRETLLQDFSKNLPPLAYRFVKDDPRRHFQYALANFGEMRRTIDVRAVTDDGSKEPRWKLTEHFFAQIPASNRVEGGPTEVDMGWSTKWFARPPRRYSGLLEVGK